MRTGPVSAAKVARRHLSWIQSDLGHRGLDVTPRYIKYSEEYCKVDRVSDRYCLLDLTFHTGLRWQHLRRLELVESVTAAANSRGIGQTLVLQYDGHRLTFGLPSHYSKPQIS